MFPAGDGKWEPYKVRKIEKKRNSASASATASANGEKKDADVEMTDAGEKKEGKEESKERKEGEREDAEESEYEGDMDNDEGAVYPLVGAFPHPSSSLPHNLKWPQEQELTPQQKAA